MPTPLVLTLPADEPSLRTEIAQQLAPHADVQEQTQAFDLNPQLFIDVLGVAANAAAVITFLLDMRERYKQRGTPSGIRVGRPGQPGTPLEQADEALLRDLLGVDE